MHYEKVTNKLQVRKTYLKVLNFIQSQKMSLIKSPLFSLSKVGRYDCAICSVNTQIFRGNRRKHCFSKIDFRIMGFISSYFQYTNLSHFQVFETWIILRYVTEIWINSTSNLIFSHVF